MEGAEPTLSALMWQASWGQSAYCDCADVAGLLEGAHAGVGLGHEFLRHTQRCKVLVHVIDGTSPDPIGDYNAIRTELELFNPALIEKPEVCASPIQLP